MMWILILTIFANGNHSAPAITVQEFNTEAACKSAATLWLASVPQKDGRLVINGYPRALCVQKTK